MGFKKLTLRFATSLSLFLSVPLFSQTPIEEALSEIFDYRLEEINFSNRSRCAIESSRPATSTFLLLNNVDPARAVYRLALATGRDQRELTSLGIDTFRIAVMRMVEFIHGSLIEGRLPLLPIDMDELQSTEFVNYQRIQQLCRLGDYCSDLDDYISQIWEIAHDQNLQAGVRSRQFLEFDQITHRHFIAVEHLRDASAANKRVNCAYLKKFSPLQAHLYGQRPNNRAMESLARAIENQDKYIASCYDLSSQEDLQVAAYQIDLDMFHERRWNQIGFDYWNSMRLYLSWAFRFSQQLDQMAFPFANIFRGVSFEDAVMFAPNGCRALAPTECDHHGLAVNAVRELAKGDYQRQARDLDVLSSLPDGPQQDLLLAPITSINNDILDLAEHPDASTWLNEFRQNVTATRNIHRTKVIRAVSFLNIFMEQVGSDRLITGLREQFRSIEENNNKQELYYLCGEYALSQHEKWSFIRGKLEILENYRLLNSTTQFIAGRDIGEFYAQMREVADIVNENCYSLDQKSVWDYSFELDRSGFAQWYIDEVIFQGPTSKREEFRRLDLEQADPFLFYSFYQDSRAFDDVICVHPSDCARRIVESMVDLYAASQYASTLWALEQRVKTPDLFNPYAERVACGSYDPWYRTKSMIFNFLWDMSQVAISSFTPGMIYTRAHLPPKMVTSFRQLVEDGEILYDVSYSRDHIFSTLAMDFGPLTGVPCGVSINGSPYAYDYLLFTGISVGACSSNEAYDLNVQSASDISGNDPRARSGCVACSLNFESISGTLAVVSQTVGPPYFFFRGLYRLFQGMRDANNFPRSWTLDTRNVVESYRRFGGDIPRSCERKLRRGDQCLAHGCEKAVSNYLRERYPGLRHYIRGFDIPLQGRGRVMLNGCHRPLDVHVRQRRLHNFEQSDARSCIVERVGIPGDCQELLL